MNVSDFLRLYPLRSPNIMWFLGAGASAAAGLPSAGDMIWEFKRTLYCSAQRVSVQTCADLGNPTLRARLQQYFDDAGGFPTEGDQDEYAFYFEAAYPSELDRRRYIDLLLGRGTPSFGHLALAAKLKTDKARIVWTTNFDRMIEDAAVAALGSSGKLVTSTLDTSHLAMQAINEGRWPLLVKLHGDFQSQRLKNTADELQAQDAELRRALVEACRRFGLAVIGYSGRDRSIIDALSDAIDGGRGYPFGLFWFHRSGSSCLPAVSDLISRAASEGIDAHLIAVETFDELLGDLLKLLPDIPSEVVESLNRHATRVSDAPMPGVGGTWPVIRLNALPFVTYPSVCRRVVCKIGGIREVREAVAATSANVIASRRNVGVIAFGSDTEVRKAFGRFEISQFDLHAIEPRRLQFDSVELGLLYETFCCALVRERPLTVDRVGSSYVAVVDLARQDERVFLPLRRAVEAITGTIPESKLRWAEAIRIRLEYRLNRLWLLMEPTIWVEHTDDASLRRRGKEFVRSRLARRYNSTWNEAIDAWASVILNGEATCDVRALGVTDGVDATFSISRTTAFTRREAP